MIISASKLTDIPAFYSKWFMNRIRAGSCIVPNPYSSEIYQISLNPEDVDCIVFRSKWPAPILKHLKELDERGYRYYFIYTLNDYSKEFEPHVPSLERRIEVFHRLADRLSAQHIIWRYDPVIITKKTPVTFHKESFHQLAEEFKGSTVLTKTKTIIQYQHNDNFFNEFEIEPNFHLTDDWKDLLDYLSRIAKNNGIDLYMCNEHYEKKDLGGCKKPCIDPALLNKLWDLKVGGAKDSCGSLKSREIGVYSTCNFRCKYCYATRSLKTAIRNQRKHDPKLPWLLLSEKQIEKAMSLLT